MGGSLEGLGSLVRLPSGCGEQTASSLAPNIYVMQYLTATNKLTNDMNARLINNMKHGYQRMLGYRHTSGGYGVWKTGFPSMWLSLFTLKLFAHASEYIYIDEQDLDRAVSWIKMHQLPNGCLPARQGYHHGNSWVKEADVSLTAYGVVAMLESVRQRANTSDLIARALGCLEAAVIEDTYTLALTTYAFTLHNASSTTTKAYIQRLNAAAIEDEGTLHWERQGLSRSDSFYHYSSAEVEMTSYALLALLSQPASQYSLLPIVHWISQQRNPHGGFSSTQDTVVALQALAKFGSTLSYTKLDLIFEIEMDDGKKVSFTVKDDNELVLQKKAVRPADLFVTAKGTGCALLQIDVRYNIPGAAPTTPAFTLTHNVFTSADSQESCKTRHIRACTKYTGPGRQSGMAVMEVNMVTGWVADVASVAKNLESPILNVKRYEILDNNAVAFYFDSVRTFEHCVSFKVRQEIQVNNTQDAHLSIYDYYNIELSVVLPYNLGDCVKQEPYYPDPFGPGPFDPEPFGPDPFQPIAGEDFNVSINGSINDTELMYRYPESYAYIEIGSYRLYYDPDLRDSNQTDSNQTDSEHIYPEPDNVDDSYKDSVPHLEAEPKLDLPGLGQEFDREIEMEDIAASDVPGLDGAVSDAPEPELSSAVEPDTESYNHLKDAHHHHVPGSEHTLDNHTHSEGTHYHSSQVFDDDLATVSEQDQAQHYTDTNDTLTEPSPEPEITPEPEVAQPEEVAPEEPDVGDGDGVNDEVVGGSEAEVGNVDVSEGGPVKGSDVVEAEVAGSEGEPAKVGGDAVDEVVVQPVKGSDVEADVVGFEGEPVKGSDGVEAEAVASEGDPGKVGGDAVDEVAESDGKPAKGVGIDLDEVAGPEGVDVKEKAGEEAGVTKSKVGDSDGVVDGVEEEDNGEAAGGDGIDEKDDEEDEAEAAGELADERQENDGMDAGEAVAVDEDETEMLVENDGIPPGGGAAESDGDVVIDEEEELMDEDEEEDLLGRAQEETIIPGQVYHEDNTTIEQVMESDDIVGPSIDMSETPKEVSTTPEMSTIPGDMTTTPLVVSLDEVTTTPPTLYPKDDEVTTTPPTLYPKDFYTTGSATTVPPSPSCPVCHTSQPSDIADIFCASKHVYKSRVRLGENVKVLADIRRVQKTLLRTYIHHSVDELCTCPILSRGPKMIIFSQHQLSNATLPIDDTTVITAYQKGIDKTFRDIAKVRCTN